MAENVNKRLHIFINNREVENNIRSISKEFTRLKNDVSNTTRGTSEYEAKVRELKRVAGILNDHRQKVSGMATAWDKVKNIAGGFLAGGFIFAGLQRLGSAISNAARTVVDFQQANANLAAILGKSRKDIKGLTDDAIRLGAKTSFSASQVSELQTEFAKLGFTEGEILAVSEATLALAAATGTDLASAAEVAGATVRGFGLSASETQRVVDVMAKSFSSSALDLESFRESMKLVAPIARAANIPIETTTALLGKLADAGLRGSIAGTSLKNLLSKLSDDNSDLARSLGFSVKNSNDLFRAFDMLAKKNIDLTEATELTDERSKAAFLTLLNGSGAARELEKALENAGGAAQKMAEEQLDTLSGEMEALSGAWESFILSLENGDGIISSIFRGGIALAREFVEAITDANKSAEQIASEKLAEDTRQEVKATLDAIADLAKERNQTVLESARSMRQSIADEMKRLRDEAVPDLIRGVGFADLEKQLRPKFEAFKAVNELIKREEEKLNSETAEGKRRLTEEEKKELEKRRKEHEKLMADMTRLERQFIEVRIRNTKEGIIEEVALATEKFRQEIEDLQNQKIKKQRLSQDELRFNDMINNLIIMKGVEHQQKIADIEKKGRKDKLAERMKDIADEEALEIMRFENEIRERQLNGEEVKNLERQKQIGILQIQLEAAEARLTALQESGAAETDDIEAQIERIRELMLKMQIEQTTATEEAWREMLRNMADEFERFGDFVISATHSVNQILANADQRDLNQFKRSQDAKKAALERRLKAGEISEEQFQSSVQQLEEESARKTAEVKRAQFERQKQADLIQATINMALAVTRYLSQTGDVTGIGAALVTAQGLLQIAAIASQPTPEFRHGAILDEGVSHDDPSGGMPVIDPRTGRVVAKVERGEAIVPEASVQANRSLVEQLIANPGVPVSSVFFRRFSPALDFASARENISLQRGGFFDRQTSRAIIQEETPASPSVITQDTSPELNAIRSELTGLRKDVNEWQRQLQVNLSVTDLEEFQDELAEIKNINSIG